MATFGYHQGSFIYIALITAKTFLVFLASEKIRAIVITVRYYFEEIIDEMHSKQEEERRLLYLLENC